MRAKKPNIILITIDSLRANHLGCYGYHRDTSPNIDSLASKGAIFLEAISNGGQTPDSFPSILASVPPPVGKPRVISQSRTTLAQQLKEAGYKTAAFHSNPYLTRYYGYSQGFDTFNYGLRERSQWKGQIWMIITETRIQRGLVARALNKLCNIKIFKWIFFRLMRLRKIDITAEKITGQALSWLNGCGQYFFLWLHYMDVHHPYLASPQYLRQFHDQPVTRRKIIKLYHKMLREPEKMLPDEVTTLIDLYDAQIRRVDYHIGWLLGSLGDRLADTIIIVTADHGEEFGEHGKFGHQSLYDGILRVPLVMYGQGIKENTIVRQQVSLIDLAPTIDNLAGNDDVKLFQGKNLQPAISGKESATGGTISVLNRSDWGRRLIAYRTSDWKYILTESTDGNGTLFSEEIYDLKSDPRERYNLHGSEDGKAKAFKLEAVGKILEFKRLKRGEETAYEKERIKARLKKSPKL